MMSPSRLHCVPLAASLCLVGGCSLVYPHYTTLSRLAPQGMLESGSLTPPGEDLHRLSVLSAEIPSMTRDGRTWDENGGPDVYAVVFRGDTEIFRTSVAPNTLRPAWDAAREYVDVRIGPSDRLRVEFRDDDDLSWDFIGSRVIEEVPSDARNGGNWRIRFDTQAMFADLQTVPPFPRLGLGITYEYRRDALAVLEVVRDGPAYLNGVRPGDLIEMVDDRAIGAYSETGAREALDHGCDRDIRIRVRRGDVTTDVTLRRDALYMVR